MPKDEMDPEDPMELVGLKCPPAAAVDETEMAECLIEEYLLQGWDREKLMRLFRDPYFRMTHDLFLRKGETWVASAIERVVDRWESPDV